MGPHLICWRKERRWVWLQRSPQNRWEWKEMRPEMERKQVMKVLANRGRTCLLLKEIKSHWGVLSRGVTWLTWLTFNKIILPFCQNRPERAGGEAGRAAGRTRVVVPMRWERWGRGCEMREWGDRFWIYFEVEPIGFAESVDYGVREREGLRLTPKLWPFWRKESSTGMKDCR